MWVVKLGGSLGLDPLLPEWLALLAQLGGGRVTVVCGGGRFAEEVNRAQAHWRFDDLAARHMAVLAMAQTACMARALQPALQLASRTVDIRHVLHGGHTALWLPLDEPVPREDIGPPWDDGADSLALDLATALNAERLVVVKSRPIAPDLSLAQLAETGVLDSGFANRAARAAFPIDLLHKADLGVTRAMLIGDGRWAGAS